MYRAAFSVGSVKSTTSILSVYGDILVYCRVADLLLKDSKSVGCYSLASYSYISVCVYH